MTWWAGALVGALGAAAVLTWPVRVPSAGLGWVQLRLPRTRPARGPATDRAPATPGPVPVPLPVPVVLELVAAALSCGLAPTEALAGAVRAAGPGVVRDLGPVVEALRLGARPEVAWQRAHPSYAPLARTLVLSARTGAAAATALRRAAVDERTARARRGQVGARRLGVDLVVPLGLLTLPAFVLLGVVPVVLGLAEQFLAGT